MSDTKYPAFARDFAPVVMALYDELCLARETAQPGELIAVSRRADADKEGLHAILVIGNRDAIDRYEKEMPHGD